MVSYSLPTAPPEKRSIEVKMLVCDLPQALLTELRVRPLAPLNITVEGTLRQAQVQGEYITFLLLEA